MKEKLDIQKRIENGEDVRFIGGHCFIGSGIIKKMQQLTRLVAVFLENGVSKKDTLTWADNMPRIRKHLFIKHYDLLWDAANELLNGNDRYWEVSNDKI